MIRGLAEDDVELMSNVWDNVAMYRNVIPEPKDKKFEDATKHKVTDGFYPRDLKIYMELYAHR